ncbi:MAG: serine hydrolase [Minisyncoccia bacterium]|jgi:D-alanyl-D-alanine carboxypeptidase
MRDFLYIVFGGLVAIFFGVTVVWGAIRAVVFFLPPSSSRNPSSATDTALPQPAQLVSSDETASSTPIIRYTALEEEDLINEAAQALPSGADNKISAKAYLVKDLVTGAISAEYAETRLLPIASLTKLVTAEIARRFIPPDMKITLTKEVMATYGNTADFKVGETFTASDLLYPLLMVSSNDAAEAYARAYGRDQFISEMNAFSQSIGAYRTYFADPSGLSPLNESTATDLGLIIDWIRKNDPAIIDTTALKIKTVRDHTWVDPTHFLSWSYYLGGKDGYTDEADRTAVSLFAMGPRKDVYAVVVLGSASRDADIVKLLRKIKD